MTESEQSPLILPQMRLDDLLAELQVRLNTVLATRDRVHALLEAVVSVGSDLDLETVLRRRRSPRSSTGRTGSACSAC
jgi:hypothetical protein